MRYTGKDSENALKIGGLVFFFFLFNKAVPSLLLTAGEVIGEEDDPQRLYNETFFVGKPATHAAGEPSQGTCIPRASCSPRVAKRGAQGEASPGRGSPSIPLCWKHGWVGICWEKLLWWH